MTNEHIAYTAAEKRSIDAAHRAIAYACDCWDWTAPDYLRRALKSGKEGGRRSATEAKTLVISGFRKGAEKPYAAADLYGMVEGFQLAHMTGAAYAARHSDDAKSRLPEILELARIAQLAADAAFERFLAR